MSCAASPTPATFTVGGTIKTTNQAAVITLTVKYPNGTVAGTTSCTSGGSSTNSCNNTNFPAISGLAPGLYSISVSNNQTVSKLYCAVSMSSVVLNSNLMVAVNCAKPTAAGTTPATYYNNTLGGLVDGLVGATSYTSAGTGALKLSNGADVATLYSGATGFAFTTFVAPATAYSVQITQQPTGQTCSLINADGVTPSPGADVTSIRVICVSDSLTSQIGGTVSGLDQGKTVLLLNSGRDPTVVVTNGSYVFANRVIKGVGYAVTVSTNPPAQVCTVSGGDNGNGTGVSAGGGVAVTNVNVTCNPDIRTFTVGGSVSGLTSSITLLNNGGDTLTVGVNGGFTFSNSLSSGASYLVTLNAQPTGQTCFLFNNSGSNISANVSNVSVACSTNTYQVGGSVSGLSASGLILQTGKQKLTVNSGDIAFAFNTSLTTGALYSVFIANQPVNQTCSMRGGNGVMGSANIDSIVVVCATNGPDTYNVLLGRPTDSSITVSILGKPSDWGGSAYVQYSTAADGQSYTNSSTVTSPTTPYPTNSVQPVIEVNLSGLAPNTKYYYRVQYQATTASGFTAGTQYSFTTQRSPGSTFSFGVQGDSHPERYGDKMFHSELYQLTMAEVAKRQPDLYFLLGDDFSSEKMVENFKLKNFPAGTVFTYANYGPNGILSFPSNYSTLTFPFVQVSTGEGDTAAVGYGTYLEQRQKYLGLMSHSTPVYTVSGNHEQAMYVNLGGIFNNNAVFAASARNKFYPGPTPVSVASFTGMGTNFYSGDTESFATGKSILRGYPGVDGDGLLRDYYAFEWGDALFVTIDPYWHATSPVDTSLYSDAENTWAKSMGDDQYFWLKGMLERNAAAGANRKKYVFLFSHHINGSGRGGANNTMVGEWGGNGPGEFAANRQCAGQPGCLVQTNWPKPIHQLLVDTKDPTGATIFFQAHDHTFARETVDGVVYQSNANPADNSYWSYNCSAYAPPSIPGFPTEYSGYGQYTANQSVVMPGAGFIYVTVSPQLVKLQYIRTYRGIDLLLNANKDLYDSLAGKTNGEVAFSYSLPAQADDDLATNNKYTCKGDAPPVGFVYNHYSVSGTLSGLGAGKYVTLTVNGGTPLTLSSNGSFTFPVQFSATANQSTTVAVASNPAGQVCTVSNAVNTITKYPAGSNVTNVSVTCTP